MGATTHTPIVCPKCSGPVWDNRLNKRNPKSPDFKCKDRSCDGVIWPPRNGRPQPQAQPTPAGYESPELGELPGEEKPIPQGTSPALERFTKLVNVHRVCFLQALALAAIYHERFPEERASLEGLSALTAQLFIAMKEGR
jgi:hypothetical protein